MAPARRRDESKRVRRHNPHGHSNRQDPRLPPRRGQRGSRISFQLCPSRRSCAAALVTCAPASVSHRVFVCGHRLMEASTSGDPIVFAFWRVRAHFKTFSSAASESVVRHVRFSPSLAHSPCGYGWPREPRRYVGDGGAAAEPDQPPRRTRLDGRFGVLCQQAQPRRSRADVDLAGHLPAIIVRGDRPDMRSPVTHRHLVHRLSQRLGGEHGKQADSGRGSRHRSRGQQQALPRWKPFPCRAAASAPGFEVAEPELAEDRREIVQLL